MKKLSLPNVRALRRLRAGAPLPEVCNSLSLEPSFLETLDGESRHIPDDALLHLERVLMDNDRLRRLIADLLPTLGIR
jgi:hypothetical protein